MQWQLQASELCLREASRDLGARSRDVQRLAGASATSQQLQGAQMDLRRQLADLADLTFTTFEERIAFLQSYVNRFPLSGFPCMLTGGGDACSFMGDANAAEPRKLREQYLAVRPQVIQILGARPLHVSRCETPS